MYHSRKGRKGGVLVRDKGMAKALAATAALGRIRVSVGVQADAGYPPPKDGKKSKATIAEYAAYNEFGTKRIPSRPFMRTAFDSNVPDLNKTIADLTKLVQAGAIDADKAGGLLGEHHRKQIQEQIGSNMPPPNSPVTVALKGSDRTLEDDGFMRGAIRWKLEKRARIVGRVASLFGRR